jgi:hypothetical protein
MPHLLLKKENKFTVGGGGVRSHPKASSDHYAWPANIKEKCCSNWFNLAYTTTTPSYNPFGVWIPVFSS